MLVCFWRLKRDCSRCLENKYNILSVVLNESWSGFMATGLKSSFCGKKSNNHEQTLRHSLKEKLASLTTVLYVFDSFPESSHLFFLFVLFSGSFPSLSVRGLPVWSSWWQQKQGRDWKRSRRFHSAEENLQNVGASDGPNQ